MKALVTGAAGFIGSHLAKELCAGGHQVRGLLLPWEDDTELVRLGAEAFLADLTDPASLEGVADDVDVVFHLATRTLDWGSYQQFASIMIDGTKNLLKASKGSIKRFVYYSSIAAFGLHRPIKGFREDDARERCGIPYCDTKIDAEDLVTSVCREFGIESVIIRPANVFGPGSVWVKEILDAMKRGPMPLIEGGRIPGGFVYVDNLVDGTILAALHPDAGGKIYHLRDDFSITWGEYLNTLGRWIGKKPRGNLSFKTAWRIGWLCEKVLTPFGIRPPLTRLSVGVLGLDNEVNTDAAKNDLGWAPKVSQDEAMSRIKTWVMTRYITG